MHRTIIYNGHKIELKNQSFTGKETILYDGNIVSKKSTLTGGIHLFTVNEESQEVSYEAEIKLRWHGCGVSTTLRRNGSVIFSDK